MINEQVKCTGDVQGIIEYKSGAIEVIEFPNTVLATGRQSLAAVLQMKLAINFRAIFPECYLAMVEHLEVQPNL